MLLDIHDQKTTPKKAAAEALAFQLLGKLEFLSEDDIFCDATSDEKKVAWEQGRKLARRAIKAMGLDPEEFNGLGLLG